MVDAYEGQAVLGRGQLVPDGLTGLILDGRRDGILEIEHQGVRAALSRLGEQFGPDARHEQKAAGGGEDRHRALRLRGQIVTQDTKRLGSEWLEQADLKPWSDEFFRPDGVRRP